jgi:twitching motility protein PilT
MTDSGDLQSGGNEGEAIFALLETARSRRASDLHVEPGQGAALRVFTKVERVAGKGPSREEVAAFIERTVDRLSRARLDKLGISDAVYADERVGAIRIHASRGKAGPRLAIRMLARSIPELDSLGLPEIVQSFTTIRSGLILIAGPTGSGKSTTAASMLDRINATAERHIVTFEDPVEYQHRWLRSVFTQYEIGRDVPSYADGVRGALRADPDVLFIGELRGIETVTACLQAAETGHAVFAALHTPSEAAQAANRLIGLFPSGEQESARMRLADALRALIGLRLLPLRDGSGLRAACEIMVSQEAVRRLIRDGNMHQLRSTIASSRASGMQTLESNLSELVANGEVDVAEARAASLYPEEIRETHAGAFRRR